MPGWVRWVLGAAVIGLVAAVPATYGPWRDGRPRNFRTVEEGVLYRSGQLPLDSLDRLIREYGIRTVVSLRDSYTQGPPPDLAEELFCKERGVHHVRISPEPWSTPDGRVPAADGVQTFVRLMDDREQYKPILLHCFAGIHRTGAHIAVFRMEFQRWTPDESIDELRAIRPRRARFENDMLDFLRTYRPRPQANAR